MIQINFGSDSVPLPHLSIDSNKQSEANCKSIDVKNNINNIRFLNRVAQERLLGSTREEKLNSRPD